MIFLTLVLEIVMELIECLSVREMAGRQKYWLNIGKQENGERFAFIAHDIALIAGVN